MDIKRLRRLKAFVNKLIDDYETLSIATYEELRGDCFPSEEEIKQEFIAIKEEFKSIIRI